MAAYKVSNKQNTFYLCLTEYLVYFPNRYSTESPNKTDCYLYGLLRLDDSIGMVSMRPETVADKVSELFSRQELDFENHKCFRSKYYLLAADHEKVKENFNFKALDALSKCDGVNLECVRQRCLFRISKKPADEANLRSMVELGLALDKALNKPQIMWAEK